jgi:hypothetical protein
MEPNLFPFPVLYMFWTRKAFIKLNKIFIIFLDPQFPGKGQLLGIYRENNIFSPALVRVTGGGDFI